MRTLARHLARKAKGYVRRFRDPKILRDVTRRGNGPKALLSYLTRAFERTSAAPLHTNILEARAWAEILGELGFRVDVVEYDSQADIDYRDYAVVCGFGEPLERTWKRYGPGELKRITYSTGCYPHFNNHAGLGRLVDHHRRNGHWAMNAARIIAPAWPAQFMIAELLIVLGNRTAAETFAPWKIFGRTEHLAAFYLEAPEPREFRLPTTAERKHLLWFGSAGCLHKGLDLVLGSLRLLPGISLHVCGANTEEVFAAGLKAAFADVWPRVVLHGHLAVGSSELNSVFEACFAVVHPSASEGGAPSVLTAVANGAMIPLITNMTGLDLPAPSTIVAASVESIAEKVNGLLVMSLGQRNEAAEELRRYVRAEYSYPQYRERLKSLLSKFC